MIKLNVKELLEKKGKSRYYLMQKMGMNYVNINKIINNETKSISFKYIEEFCEYLECSVEELITIIPDDETK